MVSGWREPSGFPKLASRECLAHPESLMQPSMPAPRAVLFDFDGTLADSYPAITASVNHVRAAHGLPPLAEAQVRPHVGRGPVHLLKCTVPGGEVDADLARYRAHHPSVMLAGTRLFPGVAETLHALCHAGVLLAVCSNKPVAFTRALLEHFGLKPVFTAILGPEDVARPKPAPDLLIAGLARLGVGAAEALYVGDMDVDVATARSAGVRVWVVPTGSDDRATLQAAQPDRLLEHFRDLLPLLNVRPLPQ
jgi:2-phosphoglycolate phosphatase